MNLIGMECHPNSKFDLNSPKMVACQDSAVLAGIFKMHEQPVPVIHLLL